MNHTNRRSFVRNSGATLAALWALPSLAEKINFGLPRFSNNEDYWEMVKAQFAIPENLIMANSANLCSPPALIDQKIQHYINEMNKNVSFQNRAVFAELRKKSISRLAQYLGAEEVEVGITRNTTEGNNIIINGIELGKGDEVVIWDQNHQSNREAWDNRAERSGFKVIRVSVPENPKDKNDLIEPFKKALSSKTRLLSFSHISNSSGIALPAKDICKLAQDNDTLTLIDGAQSCGFLDLDLHDIGCDFYTSSTHKWMLGPLENGFLYIKKDRIKEIWPDRITVSWNKEKSTVDERFCALGQRNETTPPAIIDMVDFHMTIGKSNIEGRIRDLAAYLKEQISKNVPSAQFVTPMKRELSGGVTIFKLKDKDSREVFQKLYDQHGIACAPTGGIRLSPTLSTTLSDLDKIVNALVKLA